ncbi:hypothetical protein NEF87_000570 [Candidatus Lokiarchaeum ossiferum]|uniref:ABC-2 type transport system permease protein n=1 Tax=Candidatus Lokiarchaeum ossiferum TaxID=2951803 RepID=A0ABY6HLL7_9ARCH|nr:hypothetical protein NEF87_000570 [Candidatus Lokiarchaeum sp. B-35]
MNRQELMTISKYSYKEAFLQGQMEQAGSNLYSIMEKMEKNTKYLRNQNIAMKVVMTIYVSLLIFSPISAFLNARASFGLASYQWRLFSSGLVMNLFFLMQFFYILMFGLFFASGMLSGEAFRFLSTLPIPKKDLRKISYMTFLRGIDAPAIALCLVFPFAAAIITQDIFITLICLIVSILNTIFTFSILIIIGTKMQKILAPSNTRSRKADVIRILWLIGYFIATITSAVGFQIIYENIEPFYYTEGLTLITTTIWNQILPWISFPLSGGYLIMELFIGPTHFSLLTLVASIVGVIIFGILDYILTRKALNILDTIVYGKDGAFEEESYITTVEDIQITIVSPKQAYIRRDMKLVPRDIQVIIMNIMPILFPLFGVIIGAGVVRPGDPDAIFAILGLSLFYSIFGSMMAAIGMMMVESTGTTIIQSLPIVERDQAKAKLQWICVVLLASFVIPAISMIVSPNMRDLLKYMVILWPLSFLFGIANIEYSAVIFGKLKYKYVLTEKPNIRYKTLKTATIFILNAIFAIGLILASIVTIMHFVYWQFALIFIGGEIILLFLLLLGFNKLFPKKNF